jgi:hypothetical protein
MYLSVPLERACRAEQPADNWPMPGTQQLAGLQLDRFRADPCLQVTDELAGNRNVQLHARV